MNIKRWILKALMRRQKMKKKHSIPLLVLLASCLPTMLIAEPVKMQYIYDPTGQLIKVIDSEGNLIEYIYDATGNRSEIKRSLVSGLSIFHFTPASGSALSTITIQGQGFSSVAAENSVTINGLALQVNSASEDSLTLSLPAGVSSGSIDITVAEQQTQSTRDFIVLKSSVVAAISPSLAISDKNESVSLTGIVISGDHLQGASFTFEPVYSPPALTVSATNIAADGRTATLNFDVGIDTTGTFTLIATNSEGQSRIFPETANQFQILNASDDEDHDSLINGLERVNGTNPLYYDSDADGFNDFDEVNEGSDPLDPKSLPPSVAIVHFTVFNQALASTREGEAISIFYTLKNNGLPSNGQAISPVISIENTHE